MEDMDFCEAVESMKSGERVLVQNQCIRIDCIYLYGISKSDISSKKIKITRYTIGLNHEGQERAALSYLTSDEIVDMVNERFVIAEPIESYIAKFRDMHRTAMYTLNLLTQHVQETPRDMSIGIGYLIGAHILNTTTNNN